MMEELSKESYTFALLAMIENVFIRGMMEGCTPEQIKKYVVPTMKGEKLLALALNEAPGALFFDGYSTKAVRDGDNWIINGNKCFITLGDVTDYYIVIARTGEPVNPLTGEGLVSFIVPADAEGISVGHIEKKVGWKGSHTGTVYFENVKVSDADRTLAPLFVVGANFMGALYAACDLGGAEKCIELTAAFLKGRIQEGGLSVWDAHESIRNKVAELEVKVRVLKMAVYSFLQDFSNGEPNFVGTRI
ncbi:acyl-CoA dehydrogenase [Clostridium sp. SY8519]|uniref:acyl-CoA dehydrogenase family protein n=1 Tax=Clostridium sp. (strain SY8519) TaxID=1042156 RepID=UPI0011D1DBA4|nr:acyl-CoA dehydrogenase [Clostridium sp. SY8519]